MHGGPAVRRRHGHRAGHQERRDDDRHGDLHRLRRVHGSPVVVYRPLPTCSRPDPAVGSGLNAYNGSLLVPVFRAFARFRPPRLEVRASGFGETGYMMTVEICNGTTAGGSYRFAPAALPGDGRLDVGVVRRVSLARFLLAVPRVLRGTHATMPEVALFRTRSITLRSLEGPLVLHLDAELREPDARQCTVRMEPGLLNMLVA